MLLLRQFVVAVNVISVFCCCLCYCCVNLLLMLMLFQVFLLLFLLLHDDVLSTAVVVVATMAIFASDDMVCHLVLNHDISYGVQNLCSKLLF